MAMGRMRSRARTVDYWPGFVDALSTLLLVFVFLLSVFMLAQYFLSQEITGKENVLARLTSQIRQLSEILSLERANTGSLEEQLASLRASLRTAESERDKLRGAGGGVDVKALASELDFGAGAQRKADLPDSTAQSADRGVAPAACCR